MGKRNEKFLLHSIYVKKPKSRELKFERLTHCPDGTLACPCSTVYIYEKTTNDDRANCCNWRTVGQIYLFSFKIIEGGLKTE